MNSKKDQICSFPFTRMELGQKTYVPCCGAWLTEEYHKIPQGVDFWNGKPARKLRESLLDGSYKYCRKEVCGAAMTDPEKPAAPHHLLTETMRQNILDEKIKLVEGPTSLSINVDPRCNLACASCRKGHVNTLTLKERAAMVHTRWMLRRHRKSLQDIKLSGNGEVFFSPWLKDLLKSLNKEKYPNLKSVFLLSNGLLFDQKMLDRLRPGSEFINKVSISVDAGTEEMYKRVRGGSWKKLLRNLQWMSEQRQKGRFSYINTTFTVRKENYQTLPEYVQLGLDLGLDRIKLLPLFDWHTMGISHKEEAIHEPWHPEHHKFLEVWEKIKHVPQVHSQFAIDEKTSSAQPTL